MAKRKQQRRRAKERRHEYVWEDEEGNILDPAEAKAVVRPAAAKSQPAKPSRGRRIPQPPSWRRVAKRSLIFAPLMFVTIFVLGSKLSTGAKVVQTVVLLGFFLPFSYVMDSFTYKAYLRKTGQAPPPKKR